MMSRSPLLERYAERLRITPEEARSRLFYECIPNWKRGFVRMHRVVRPGLYQMDVRLVEEAGKATSYQAVLDALDRWNHRTPTVQSVARNRWQWRVSGRRLLTLALALFQDQEIQPPASPAPVSVPLPMPVPPPVSPLPAKVRNPAEADVVRAHG